MYSTDAQSHTSLTYTISQRWLPNMDMQLLKTFVAAYEEASFTKAAQRLNATQPGVSVKIATLEADVGMPLFERNTRSVTPTVAGRRLYPRALQLIHDLNSAAQEIRSLAGTVAGQVAVGIPPTLSKAILAPVLSGYLDAFPSVDVRIFEAHSDTLLELVERSELDFAVVTKLADHPSVNYRKVFRDRFVVASAACNLGHEGPIHLNVEPYFKIVVLRCALHGALDEPLRTGRIVPARLVEIDGLAGTFEFLAMTDWVALLPSATAYSNSERSGVRFNRLAGEQIPIDYYVAHGRTEPISEAGKAFIQMMIEEFERVPVQWRSRALGRPVPRSILRGKAVLSEVK
jgi:LysR family transcriptional regulator, nitrogen assimilation regulatory protein